MTVNSPFEGRLTNLKYRVNSNYAKHIAVSFHYASEITAKGQVEVKYVDSAKNVADLITKPLLRDVFQGKGNRTVFLTLHEGRGKGKCWKCW